MITEEQIQAFNNECEKNKKSWPPGPWNNEPNRVEWEHAGFRCLALRQPQSGHWCGYVGLPKGHKHYGIPDSVPYYDDDGNEIKDRQVVAFELSYGHGGVTYGRFCQGDVCHISDNEELYWLGFDCAHSGDLTPSTLIYAPNLAKYGTYKTIGYVKQCVNEMAEELSTNEP